MSKSIKGGKTRRLLRTGAERIIAGVCLSVILIWSLPRGGIVGQFERELTQASRLVRRLCVQRARRDAPPARLWIKQHSGQLSNSP
jgi:hypothetical protein